MRHHLFYVALFALILSTPLIVNSQDAPSTAPSAAPIAAITSAGTAYGAAQAPFDNTPIGPRETVAASDD